MKNNRLDSWLKKIYDTQDREISCSECFDLVSRFVELEVSGGEPAAEMPQVSQHLRQCAACREEYETLRDLRRLEDQGRAPSLDDLRRSLH